MRESKIEKRLCEQVEAAGGHAYKFKSPQRKNVPDRIVVWPRGQVCFVELKAPGEEPTPGQAREHTRLRSLGLEVRVIDSIEGVARYVAPYALVNRGVTK